MALPPCRRSDVHITKHRNHPKEHAMSTSRFIQRFGDKITGVLSGFDRLVLRGSLLAIVPVEGMKRVLWLKNILLKDFGRWAERMTAQLKEASLKAARDQQRPIVYLQSASTDKEEVARKIATKDGITTRSEEHTSELQSRQYLVCR